MASNDFAERVINGTYKKKKQNEQTTTQNTTQTTTQNTTQASNNFAESVINGTYKSPKPIETKPTQTTTVNLGTETNEDLKAKVGGTIIKGSDSPYYKSEYENPADILANIGNVAINTIKRPVSTVTDAGLDFLEGGMGYLEGGVDWATYRLADLSDLIGQEEWANDLRKNADFDSTGTWFGHNQDVQQNILGDWQNGIESNSISPDYVDQLFKGAGQIGVAATGAALTGYNPIAQAAITYTSAYGNARSEAKRNGASDRDANRAGVISAISETISENLFAGVAKLPVIGGAGSKLTKNITGKVSNAVKKYFGSKAGKIAYGVIDTLTESLGEGAEEILSNVFTAVGNDIVQHVIDKDFNYGMEGQTGKWWEDAWNQVKSKDSLDQFISAALTSVLVAPAFGAINAKAKTKMIEEWAKDNNVSVEEATNILTKQMPEMTNQEARTTQEINNEQVAPETQEQAQQQETQQNNLNEVNEQSIANDSNAFNLGKNQQIIETEQNNRGTLQEGLEKQAEKTFQEAENDYQAVKQNIEDYLEENNIENPTKEDMLNAFGWYEEFDGSQDMSDMQRAERLYNEVADDLLKERNNNLAETKSEDVIKIANDTVKKFNNAKNGDVFKQVEQEQGRPLRQGVKTITTATGTTELVSKMDGSLITYEPKSNQKTLEESRERNKGKSLEQRYKEEIDFINSDKRITADAIADIETLIMDLKADFNNPENVDMFLNLVQQAATLGTADAQALQFMSVIKKLDPQTQLDTLINLVEKSKLKGDKTFDGVELDQDLVKKVLEAGNDKAKFNNAMDELTLDLAKQASKNVTFMEKVNAWRYLSMLGNLKTHGRNMLGNGLMYGLQTFKDTVGSIGEDIYDTTAKALGGKGLTERTKTTFSSLRATKDIKNYVNNRVNEFFETQENNSKYNDSKNGMLNNIKRKRKMFNERTIIGKALNKLSNINGRLLDIEDKIFSRAMTKQAMKKYLVANGIKTNADIEANPEIVGRALDYAFFQGQQATYHQDSKTAQIINDIKEKSKTGSIWTKGLGLTVEATMPFVKTPINIAKNSLEYTPVLGSLDLVNQFKNAPKEIRGAMVIDNLSKQFSGFSLAALGAYLASQGILNGSGGNDKKDKLEKDLGLADYSIRIGNNTYDLSWLAPTSIPLFEGVEIYNSLKDGGIDADTLIDTLFGALDPVQDMSVFQSIERLGKAVFSNNKANMFKSVAEQTFSNYLSQFIPTLMSQLAEATDDKKRNSYSSKTVLGKTWDQLKYKIPGLRQTLPEEVDIWGEPKKNADNIFQRSFEAFISPANRKEYRVDDTTKKLEELSDRVGTEVLPTEREKSVSVNGKTYSLDGKEFAEYEKTFGKTAKKEIEGLLNSNEYKQADDETKKKMIEELYKYSNYKYKKQYSDSNDIDYDNSQENRFALVDAFDMPYYKLQGLRLSDLSKKSEKMEAIDQSGLTQEQKDAINLIQNYKYYDADVPRLINVINNSNLSKKQKEYLINKIKKNSTKGGK